MRERERKVHPCYARFSLVRRRRRCNDSEKQHTVGPDSTPPVTLQREGFSLTLAKPVLKWIRASIVRRLEPETRYASLVPEISCANIFAQSRRSASFIARTRVRIRREDRRRKARGSRLRLSSPARDNVLPFRQFFSPFSVRFIFPSHIACSDAYVKHALRLSIAVAGIKRVK